MERLLKALSDTTFICREKGDVVSLLRNLLLKRLRIVFAAAARSASFSALCTALMIAERSTFSRQATSLPDFEDFSPFDSSDENVVESAGRIDAGLTGHPIHLSLSLQLVNIETTSLSP